MSVKPEEIAAARALRDEARCIVTANLGEVRTDLSPQTITKTIKHKASNEAMHLLDETRSVAAENKIVIGGTIIALLAWVARKSLITALRRIPLPRQLERLWPWLVR
jgi:hypothetical protein